MQFFRNAVLSGPISFLVLAFLRQAVRLACLFAAASAADWAAGDGFAAAIAEVAAAEKLAVVAGAAAASVPASDNRLRHKTVVAGEKRMICFLEECSHHRRAASQEYPWPVTGPMTR